MYGPGAITRHDPALFNGVWNAMRREEGQMGGGEHSTEAKAAERIFMRFIRGPKKE